MDKLSNRRKPIVVSIALITAAIMANSHAAMAAAVPAGVSSGLPATVDPSVARQELAMPASAPLPIPTGAATVTPGVAPTNMGPQAQAVKFQLNQVIVSGNTVFSAAQLAPLYKNYLGKQVSLAELGGVVDAITQKYRQAGYVLSQAILPPQHIENGVVKIQVVEGYIDQIKVQGNVGKVSSLLQSYGQHISQSRPLQVATLEKYVLLANDIPGMQVQAVLRPSATTPGAADLIFVAQEKDYTASYTFDNRGTLYMGPNRNIISGSVSDLITPGDNTTGLMVFTPSYRELNYYQITRQDILNSYGTKLVWAFDYTNTNPQFILQDLNVEGTSSSGTVSLVQPLMVSRRQNLSANFGLNVINSNLDILDTEQYYDKIRALQGGVDYQAIDPLQGVNGVNFYATQGLNALGSSQEGDGFLSRPDADGNFTKFNLDLTRLQQFTQRISLLLGASGQYSFDPLLTAEEMSVGGADYGRAYDPSEIIGDRGYEAKAELRYQTWPYWQFIQTAQFFTYFDGGKVWNFSSNDPQLEALGQAPVASLTSTGIGVRMDFSKYLSGSVEWDQPLTRVVEAEEIDGNGKAPRVFFSVTAQI